jgi:hypothetical protein
VSLGLNDSIYVSLMMEKPHSYYDWEIQFNLKKKGKNLKKEKRKNSLGIENYQFKEFLEKWKKKNLPEKGNSRIILF